MSCNVSFSVIRLFFEIVPRGLWSMHFGKYVIVELESVAILFLFLGDSPQTHFNQLLFCSVCSYLHERYK